MRTLFDVDACSGAQFRQAVPGFPVGGQIGGGLYDHLGSFVDLTSLLINAAGCIDYWLRRPASQYARRR